jgi:transketolase
MPCWEVFERQSEDYRAAVFPPAVRARVAVEAGSDIGWRRYVGLDGGIIARRGFGASAPLKDLLKQFGFTVENVLSEARATIERVRALRTQ